MFTLANFYLSTWEEYHTGVCLVSLSVIDAQGNLSRGSPQTLYLSAFSGPIEGILLIVILYIITGFNGMSQCPSFIRLAGHSDARGAF